MLAWSYDLLSSFTMAATPLHSAPPLGRTKIQKAAAEGQRDEESLSSVVHPPPPDRLTPQGHNSRWNLPVHLLLCLSREAARWSLPPRLKGGERVKRGKALGVSGPPPGRGAGRPMSGPAHKAFGRARFWCPAFQEWRFRATPWLPETHLARPVVLCQD